ncbi:MAG: efflux RND transporter periplasmic adaptor subunit [Parachlamydiaceae bacterium]|nr:efflux RND transporter periplasmic adaptor subunit [Parachlamydiaceae bacterium]
MYKIIGSGLALCLILVACDPVKPPLQNIPATPVTASLPVVRDLPVYIESIGTLESSFFVEVRPQMSGIIEKIYVQEGDWVKAGQPLFEIDSKVYQIKVKEAEAQLLSDRVAYEAAKKKHERFLRLAKKDLVAQVEWDEIEMQTARGEANLGIDLARLDAAKLDLERCTIYAVSDGRIGRVDIHPGTLVSREQAGMLVTLSRNDPLIVNFHVTEKEFGKLPKEKLTLEVFPLCDKSCASVGNVTFLDGRFDAKSGLLFVRGQLLNPENRLSAGQSVKIRMPVDLLPNVTFILQKAVKFNQQGPYAYVINSEDVIEFRQLILGDETGEEVAVREGISPEERIITSSHARLSPGIKVEVQP